jgi:hypothetical protein
MSVVIMLTLIDVLSPSRSGIRALAHSALKALMILPTWSELGRLNWPTVGAIVGAGFVVLCVAGFSYRLMGERATTGQRVRRPRTP